MTLSVKFERPPGPGASQAQLFSKDFSTLDSEIFT